MLPFPDHDIAVDEDVLDPLRMFPGLQLVAEHLELRDVHEDDVCVATLLEDAPPLDVVDSRSLRGGLLSYSVREDPGLLNLEERPCERYGRGCVYGARDAFRTRHNRF